MGRTGSGKTTILMALFRLLDLAGGSVLVDGADIASLPLKEVGMLGLLCCHMPVGSQRGAASPALTAGQTGTILTSPLLPSPHRCPRSHPLGMGRIPQTAAVFPSPRCASASRSSPRSPSCSR